MSPGSRDFLVDKAAWQAHLNRLGIRLTGQDWCSSHPGPCADRHRRSSVGQHSCAWVSAGRRGAERRCRAVRRSAALWVHAERLVHKLDTFTDLHRAAQQRIRKLIWKFYPISRFTGLVRAKIVVWRCAHGSIGSFRRRTGLRHAGSIAEAAPCQQDELLILLQQTGNPAAYQRLRKRYPLPGHPPQGQRRNPQRPGARLPRCLPRACQKPAPNMAWRSGTIWAVV